MFTILKKNFRNNASISWRLWLYTWLVLNGTIILYTLSQNPYNFLWVIFISTFISFIGGLPALVLHYMGFCIISQSFNRPVVKMKLLYALAFFIAGLYGFAAAILLNLGGLFDSTGFFETLGTCTSILAGSAVLPLIFYRHRLHAHFYSPGFPASAINQTSQNKTNLNMEQYQHTQQHNSENKPLTKGLLTGGLILLLLIPTFFISGLVNERQQRQREVVKDVSSKWASAQTITGPYLFIPYIIKQKDMAGKEKTVTKEILLLPDNLDVNGKMLPEQRLRSIYKVLLYKTSINSTGNFLLQLPKNIDPSSLLLSEAKVCMGISDFKGIEKKIDIVINGNSYTLSPGLPTDMIDSTGLSASVDLSTTDLSKPVSFEMPLQLKGSEQLHFVPLSGNSQFSIQSPWTNPSFDGNTIPTDREVNETGFKAKWVFNKANLPFNTLLKDEKINKESFAFGITMLQPADQYSKTTRSVKYAILIIGLTFSLFFIIELMQKKPIHPVQYVLIGLALVIFYTLLLSISEFVLFDQAYLIAAIATISLITLYAKSHFKTWKIAALFGSILSALYAFIFILIRLEDTALLVGSIGLFIVLSLVMYASRKINWYQSTANENIAAG